MKEHSLTIEKPRLPAGRTYPLKTSLLTRALADASIPYDIQLRYWTPQADGSVLQAFYWPANPNVQSDRVLIRAGSVAVADRQRAIELLVERALPAFVGWLKAVQALPTRSPLHSEELTFDATLKGNELSVFAKPRPN